MKGEHQRDVHITSRHEWRLDEQPTHAAPIASTAATTAPTVVCSRITGYLKRSGRWRQDEIEVQHRRCRLCRPKRVFMHAGGGTAQQNMGEVWGAARTWAVAGAAASAASRASAATAAACISDVVGALPLRIRSPSDLCEIARIMQGEKCINLWSILQGNRGTGKKEGRGTPAAPHPCGHRCLRRCLRLLQLQLLQPRRRRRLHLTADQQDICAACRLSFGGSAKACSSSTACCERYGVCCMREAEGEAEMELTTAPA